MRTAFRVDADARIGMGHLFRCLHLAAHVRERLGWEPVFFLLGTSLATAGARFLAEAGFPARDVSAPGEPGREDTAALARQAADCGARVAVVDLLEPDPGDEDLAPGGRYPGAWPGPALGALRAAGLATLAFSDRADRFELPADAVVNACPAQRPEWYAGVAGQEILLGPEHYVLGPSFVRVRGHGGPWGAGRVVLFFGGNDHRDFASVALPVLEARPEAPRVCVVVGAGTPDGERVAEAFRGRGHEAVFGAPDLAPVLAGADLAVVAAGNTLFDLAALGVPAAAVSTRERQRVTARHFADRGACFDLGMEPGEIAVNLNLALDALAADPDLARRMAEAGRAAVDGRGAARIARALARLAKNVGAQA